MGSGLIKMKIIGFKEGKFKTKRHELTLQINPGSLKYTMGVSYSQDKRMGVAGKDIKFDACDNSSLSFDILLDDTGIIPLAKGCIVDTIHSIEEVFYNIDGETHEPNYLHINWGSFNYKGRVKIATSVTGYMDKLYESQIVQRRSPDLSRMITLKSGESVAWWCNEIYGDASYCVEVAKYNRLSGFRSIPPGTVILFPPLARGEN